jgi:hypothetical protein
MGALSRKVLGEERLEGVEGDEAGAVVEVDVPGSGDHDEFGRAGRLGVDVVA